MRAELINSNLPVKKSFKMGDIFQSPPSGQYWLPGLFAEIFLNFLFWCQIVDLIPTVWFQPMSQLTQSESGEEYSYVIGYFGCLFLSIGRYRRFIIEEPSFAYTLTILGVLSYATNSLFFRTVLLTFSLCVGTGLYFMQFWVPRRRARAAWCLISGLFMFVSLRYMFSTLTPIWLSMGTTWGTFFVGVLAAGLLSNDPEFLCLTEDTEPENHIENSRNPKSATWLDTIRFGLGFGALYFVTHWILTSHGLIARWIGVDPFYYGIAMMFSFAGGMCLWHHEAFVRSPLWYSIGVVSSVGLLIFPKSISWIFGLSLTSYVTSIWSVALLDVPTHAYMIPGLILATGVYCIFHFGVAWSVAWCFVPKGTGGPFMRQRSAQEFTFTVMLLGLAYFKSTSSYFQHRLKACGAALTASTASPNEVTPVSSAKQGHLNRVTPQLLFTLVVLILLFTTPAILKRAYHHGNVDGRGVQKEYISGAIWAIRFGYDNFGWPNFFDVARKIKEVGANTIGLVETDIYRPINGNRDLIEYLEESLHMYSDYGPSTLNDTWGCALLTVFPILRIERINQPSPDGEVACLIDATLNVNGEHIDVFVTHFGNTEHYRDRHLQARSIAHRVAAKKKAGTPVVWLGYLTDRPGGPNYKQLTDAGLVDSSPSEMERYCLYLFHMGMTVSDFKRIEMTEDISDTEIQMASFKLK